MFFGAQVVQNVEKKMGYIYEKSIVAQIVLTHQLISYTSYATDLIQIPVTPDYKNHALYKDRDLSLTSLLFTYQVISVYGTLLKKINTIACYT